MNSAPLLELSHVKDTLILLLIWMGGGLSYRELPVQAAYPSIITKEMIWETYGTIGGSTRLIVGLSHSLGSCMLFP